MGTKFEKLLVSETSSRIEDAAYSIILEPSEVILRALYDGTYYFFMVAPESHLAILELENM